MNEYAFNEVERIDTLLKQLYLDYNNKPFYLKETLRKIRTLVHLANLQADGLIVKEWFKDYDPKVTIDTLTKEFPNLRWEGDYCNNNYIVKGTLDILTVNVNYQVNWIDSIFNLKEEQIPYWELDIYLNNNGSCIGLFNPSIEKFNSLQEVVMVIKTTLKPLCNLFTGLGL